MGSTGSLSSGVQPEVIARCLRERPFRPVPGGSLRKFLADSSVSAFLPGSGSVGPRSSGNRAQTPDRTPVCVPKLEEPVCDVWGEGAAVGLFFSSLTKNRGVEVVADKKSAMSHGVQQRLNGDK